VTDEQRAAAGIEVALVQVERFLDPQPGTPQHHDQPADPIATDTVSGLAHDRDDLLDPRRIGRVAHPLVPRRTAQMEL
jgi:hypothetical protein